MRTRLLTVVSLALGLMALALPARAAGAETRHVQFQGLTAQAEFSSTQGCVRTRAYVLATDGHVKTDPGGPEAASGAEVYLFQEDVCTQTRLLGGSGFAELAPDAFQIDKEFTAATLTATIEWSDFESGTSFPVHISMRWTGFGDTFSDDERYRREDPPGVWVNFHLNGTFRQATASGTVSDGTTNFTPEPALLTGNTRLGLIKVGEVDITHQ